MAVSSEAGERSGDLGRVTRSLATALLPGTALVVVTVIAHTQQTTTPSGNGARAISTTAWHHHRSRFLWISAAVLFSAWIAIWIIHSSSRVRRQIIQWKQGPHKGRVVLFFYASLSALALGLGAYGLSTCSGKSDPQHQPGSYSILHTDVPNAPWATAWPLAMAMATAVAWLVAAAVLAVLSIVAVVRELLQGQEAPPALMLLRCSCCSRTVQRTVLALPFASLAVASGVLWRQAATSRNVCATARELLLGSTIVFGSIVLALGAATVGPILWRALSFFSSTTRSRRRACHAVIFCVLVGFGIATIMWAVKSWRWLSDYDKNGHRMDCVVDAATTRAVRFTTGALFTAGVLLLAMTSCCRLERHLLPTAATPQIDLSMLSPHAIRPPALTKSPEEV